MSFWKYLHQKDSVTEDNLYHKAFWVTHGHLGLFSSQLTPSNLQHKFTTEYWNSNSLNVTYFGLFNVLQCDSKIDHCQVIWVLLTCQQCAKQV